MGTIRNIKGSGILATDIPKLLQKRQCLTLRKTKPNNKMAYSRINQAQEYLQEIKDLVENPEIHLTTDFDLDSLFKAKNYIKAFIQKQQ